MLLKMWLDPGAPPQLAGLHIPPIGSQLVHSLSMVGPISTKAHTNWLRNSFSWHAVAVSWCLRQTDVIFHYFHNLPLSQKLDPRLDSSDIPVASSCANIAFEKSQRTKRSLRCSIRCRNDENELEKCDHLRN